MRDLPASGPLGARLWRRLDTVLPLPHARAIIGLVAAGLSIGGSLYGYHKVMRPADRGELVAFVREGRTGKPLVGATVEVRTPHDVLITSLTITDQAGARHALQEGLYRVRVTYPRFRPEVRMVQVLGGQRSEVRFRLARATRASRT